MSRDIKFRGWNKTTTDYVYSDYCMLSTFFGYLDEGEWVIQQYSGLKDKNEVEIYEGDVIKSGPYEDLGKVIFEYGSFMLITIYGGTFTDTYQSCIHGSLIGNIFENPDLFKSIQFKNTQKSNKLASCDNCNKKVNIDLNSSKHDNCDFIYGRRGCRQLGVYDG